MSSESEDDKIGIFDPEGVNLNPLTNLPYSDNYRKLAEKWSMFPAYLKADEILDSIKSNQITFIISGTGSGKSTLIPKFALHFTGYKGKIVMTLPKRIITLSAASFAAETLDVELGKDIGYAYKGSDKQMLKPENKIVYVTDGYLVMQLVRDPLLTDYSVIIIDEAHERRVQIDLLLLFLKKIIESGKRPDLRIIIMSATIDGEKYQRYFSGSKSKIVHISGQPNHEIKTFFLDEPAKSYMFEGLKVIENLVKENIKKDTLFFITTSNEALELCKTIRSRYRNIYCIEVYSEMDKHLKEYATDKDKYLELGNYDQKLIMATNVAESSLTIDGLAYIIDSGYELYSYFDPNVYGQILEKRLITKAQALQRRGRVGRTEPGVCYHLLTKSQFDSLQEYPTPDILKQDITIDILNIMKSTESKTLSESYKLLGQLMDPPKPSYVDVAKDIFEMYKIVDDGGRMTEVGYAITQYSSLPINRTLFLIYSFQLHCAREASVILAMMDVLNGKINNLFYKSDTICESGCEKQASNKLIKNVSQKRGDHFTFLKVYQEFKKASDKQSWFRKYGIRSDVFKDVDRMSNGFFYKILNLSKMPPLSRVNKINVKKNLLRALKLSHKHLTASNGTPSFSQKRITSSISRDSVVHYYYKKKDLEKKKIIYDRLVSINNKWEFNIVTII